ncbi:MAG TPA: hypothetical protein VKV26_23690 [Dehalococcoidia bacterium]|nr:hypothetical protein [Dehalococcoidia bacterium]
MTAATAEAALDAFIEAAMRQDIPAVLGSLLPEALPQLGVLNLAGIGTLQSHELLERRAAGADTVLVVRLHADEDVELKVTWRESNGAWKIAGASRVQPAAGRGVMEQAAGAISADLRWLAAPTEWGVRAPVGSHGLTLDAINIGSYGVIPAHSAHATQRPRGAAVNADTPGMGISIFEQAEVWSPIAASLYEEAIQRRWSPATDVPWESLAELAPEDEAAICQLCTSISERQMLAADVPAGWEHRISYDFHEVKLFLATQIFDAARHVEAFRKRALANGGGLGRQSPGNVARLIAEAQVFSEFSLLLHVLVGAQTALWLRIGAACAPGPAEYRLFALAQQDAARHLAYGLSHLRFLLEREPGRAAELQRYLDKGEGMLASDLERDQPLRDALARLLRPDGAGAEAGSARLDKLGERWIAEYLARLRWAGLAEREQRLDARLKAVMTNV